MSRYFQHSLREKTKDSNCHGGLNGFFSLEEVNRIISLSIIESINEPFTIIDKQYRILWVSREASIKNLIGTLCYEAYQKRKSPCDLCPVDRVFETRESYVAEKLIHCQKEGDRWAEVRTYPVFDEEGTISYALKIGYDITSKRLELELQKKKVARLENALRALAKGGYSLSEYNKDGIRIKLTRRELDVLHLMAEGLTNTDISQALRLSHHTVKSHIINIFNKLGVSDRTQAAVWAARLHII